MCRRSLCRPSHRNENLNLPHPERSNCRTKPGNGDLKPNLWGVRLVAGDPEMEVLLGLSPNIYKGERLLKLHLSNNQVNIVK